VDPGDSGREHPNSPCSRHTDARGTAGSTPLYGVGRRADGRNGIRDCSWTLHPMIPKLLPLA
jgi:hypothetical protein